MPGEESLDPNALAKVKGHIPLWLEPALLSGMREAQDVGVPKREKNARCQGLYLRLPTGDPETPGRGLARDRGRAGVRAPTQRPKAWPLGLLLLGREVPPGPRWRPAGPNPRPQRALSNT